MSDPLTSLVKKIDQRLQTVRKTARPPGVYVLFDSKAGGLADQIRGMAKKEAIQRVLLCIGPPPRNYQVNGEAAVTVVIYRIGKRRLEPLPANFALRRGELDEAKVDAIVKALSDVLPR